jgi:hypothetical protein
MGLDWNPGPRAKPGHEQEFAELWQKLHRKWCFGREKKVARFKAITLPAFETLAAPRAGVDPRADEWVREQYPKRLDKTLSEAAWREAFRGFHVLPLVPACDGLPRYTNGAPGGYVEAYAFRGQFLKDSEAIIGADLVARAWDSKNPAETLSYGNHLLERAQSFIERERLDPAKISWEADDRSNEFRVDVVLSAGRWCRFWAERGHWLEAYF